jgi:hypothetical protein
MVVEGHAGDVEEVCFGGVAGGLYDERLGVLVLKVGACGVPSVWQAQHIEGLLAAYPRLTRSARQSCAPGSRYRQSGKPGGSTSPAHPSPAARHG